jgi:serine/threonine protein kinase
MTDLDDRAMDLFAEVVGLGREQRSELLDAECTALPGLRARVEELLADHQEAETKGFLEPPPDSGGDESPPNLRRYRTPKLLGKGGMGVVWLVRDQKFRRRLAVKVMLAAASKDRFFAEARITARLAHPSIVPVHAMGWLADGRPYYTMKLVEGETLADLLKRGSDMTSQRMYLLQVFARVCQALAFAHKQGVIHRDLKPSNIMVGKHGEVQVMDWGLAKELTESDVLPAEAARTNGTPDESDDHTEPGSVMGTWQYMSPEQANGWIEEVDRRSDVFGLGGMLCVILTGKPPYDGPTTEDVIRQAKEADLAGAYARLEGCGADAELIGLARACLSAKPKDRPEGASVVEKRLTDYLTSVEERLQQAKLAEAGARARAESAEKLADYEGRLRRKIEIMEEFKEQARQSAEENARQAQALAEAEKQARKQAEKSRRRMLRLMVGLGIAGLALVAAGLFAWRAHIAVLAADRDREAEKLAREAEKRQHAIDRALTAAMGGDLKAADQATAEAERRGASPGQVHMLRGQIALHRGQSREAMGHLEEAVRLLPESVAARGMLAAAYAADGQWDQYDKTMKEIEKLSPSTPEDFLFKGYAEANLDPKRGLESINQAFARRPMMGIALLLRAEVRADLAQDTDNLAEAEGAVQDARYARELLPDNPAALWVSLFAHLAKAGVHDHRGQLKQRGDELDLAGECADALKPFTKLPTLLPEAVVYRWLYFREKNSAEKVLDELQLASEKTEHTYVAFCYALTLYRRGKPDDLTEARRVLEKKPGRSHSRLRLFVLAEHDGRALPVVLGQGQAPDSALSDQTVLCLLGKKEEAVKACKELREHPELFYTLRGDSIKRCVDYHAGGLTEEELVKAAEGSQWNQCMAHYHIGMRKLAEGDRAAARGHFDKAVTARAFYWTTYDMSWVFLARLKNDPTWPQWIPPRGTK